MIVPAAAGYGLSATLLAFTGIAGRIDDDVMLSVILPLDAVVLPLRCTGPDRDPGWVPWLHRSVRIAHADGAVA